jgi:chromosome partitioning protein
MYATRKIQQRLGWKIAVINRKGGVGKTMAVTNLAGELALRGYNVGIVDGDSQGNAATYLGLAQEDGLFKAMVGNQQEDGEYVPVPLREVIRQVPQDAYYAPIVDPSNQPYPNQEQFLIGNVYLIPSANNTFRIPYLSGDTDMFGDLLDEYVELCQLDFVLIDTAPTMSMFDGSVYVATDAFVYVTELEVGSLQGLASSVEQVKKFNKRRERMGKAGNRILGVIPNKKRAMREHVENLQKLHATFPGLVTEPVRQLKNYTLATKYGITLRAFDYRGGEALEISKVVDFIENQIAVAVMP